MRVAEKRIDKLGSVEIKLPILTIGEGKPIISIVTGLHGDETTGLFVIKELLKKVNKIKGALRILPCSNPFAQGTRLRRAIIDQTDINRVFTLKGENLTKKTAKILLSTIKDSDLVIDLHSSKLETPLMGVLFKGLEENSKMLKIFNPKQVWVISESEEKYKHTLCTQLNKLGVPNFGVELNKEENFTSEEIIECVNGIINILRGMKMIPGKIKNNKKIPFFTKVSCECASSGIFTPLKNPFDKIKKDDVIGFITSLPSFKEELVKAENKGVLMQVARNKLVLPGQILFSIGMLKN
jgi:predicted deacylase